MATSKADNVLANLVGAEGEGMQYYSPHLMRALDIGMMDAVFVFYVARWSRSAWDGWCFRTEEQIEYDTMIPARTLRRIRDRLRDMGILAEERRGLPARMYYRINAGTLLRLLGEAPPVPPPPHDSAEPEVQDKLGQFGRTGEDRMAGLYKENTKENTCTPPTPPRGEAITSKTKMVNGSTGTRLPDDWTPSPEDVAFARSRGVPENQVADLAGEFRDYWLAVPGAKGRKLDWSATWRNHVRREERRFKPAGRLTVVRSPEEQGQEERRKAAYMAKWKTI
jgi:DNA-binding transcriptional ArsR family regulator